MQAERNVQQRSVAAKRVLVIMYKPLRWNTLEPENNIKLINVNKYYIKNNRNKTSK